MAKRKGRQQPEAGRRDGGLCVAFTNSGSDKRRGFTTYGELLAWSLAHRVLSGGEFERLERAAAECPADAAAVARRALELRARFGRILRGLMHGKGPNDRDLAVLGAELASARAAQRFVRVGTGCRWVWGDRDGDELDRMLWPVVTSMAEVLATKYHRKVRECAGEGYDLLFVDRAPGSPRKWCSMRACGNKVKSKRDYYRRVKPRREERRRTAERARRERSRERREERKREAEPR